MQVRMLGLRIKQFVTAFNINVSDIENNFIFFFITMVNQTTEYFPRKGNTDESSYKHYFIEIRESYRDYIPGYTDDSRSRNYVACVKV